jgi:hypothetical protein
VSATKLSDLQVKGHPAEFFREIESAVPDESLSIFQRMRFETRWFWHSAMGALFATAWWFDSFEFSGL